MRFARFIAKRLDKRGTQSDLAKELNISRSTITAWRQGAKPAFEICLQLAEHFGLPPAEIFSMVGDDSYGQIYRRFVEKTQRTSQSGHDALSSSNQADDPGVAEGSPLSQEHLELHDKLQVVIESHSDEAEAIATMIEMAHRQLSRRQDEASLSVPGKITSVYRRQKDETAQVIRQRLRRKKNAEAGGLGPEVIPQES